MYAMQALLLITLLIGSADAGVLRSKSNRANAAKASTTEAPLIDESMSPQRSDIIGTMAPEAMLDRMYGASARDHKSGGQILKANDYKQAAVNVLISIGSHEAKRTAFHQRQHLVRVDEALAPASVGRSANLPQSLTLGSFKESAQPFISQDVWFELVDQKHVVMLRLGEPGFPSPQGLVEWLDSLSHSVSILVNNQKDISFPPLPGTISFSHAWKDVLEHRNLGTFFVGNPSIVAPNIIPIPLGPKWNFIHTEMFSESKTVQISLYTALSSDKETTAELFSASRKPLVWIRPMASSSMSHNYARDNKALKTTRAKTVQILQENLDQTHLIVSTKRMEAPAYLDMLKSVAFVASPTGNGLDSHGTWEALMAGCVPILPHSPLDKMFADLPVWLVNDWSEVTPESMKQKRQELHNAGQSYNFGKLFAPYWKTLFAQLLANSSIGGTQIGQFREEAPRSSARKLAVGLVATFFAVMSSHLF